MAIFVSYLGLNKLSGMNERLNGIVDNSAMKVKLAARINQDLIEINRAEKNIVLAKTQKEMDEYAENIAKIRKRRSGRLQGLTAMSGLWIFPAEKQDRGWKNLIL